MKKDKNRGAEDASALARISDDERQKKLTQLVLRRSKLTPDEAALLGEVFPAIVDAHRVYVINLLRKQGVEDPETEDVSQEVFIALHIEVLEYGFLYSIKEMLSAIIRGKSWNHQRAKDRSPLTTGTVSSGSEKPVSQFDVERALHFRRLARLLVSQLSPESQAVLDRVYTRGLTHTEAAAALGIPEGTLKTRLRAALSALSALAEPLVSPSEKVPL